jgi:HAMP domain-containing protein
MSRAERQESAGTSELSAILSVLTELQRGNASVRLPAEWTGMFGKIAETFNDVVEQNESMYGELERLSRVVGREGKLNKRASVGYVRGFWRDSIECVNGLIDDLVHPTTETARVIGAVAQGDLGQTMALEIDDRPLQGEFLRTAKTVNKMVNQSARSPQRSRGLRARSAPRASSAARPK